MDRKYFFDGPKKLQKTIFFQNHEVLRGWMTGSPVRYSRETMESKLKSSYNDLRTSGDFPCVRKIEKRIVVFPPHRDHQHRVMRNLSKKSERAKPCRTEQTSHVISSM